MDIWKESSGKEKEKILDLTQLIEARPKEVVNRWVNSVEKKNAALDWIIPTHQFGYEVAFQNIVVLNPCCEIPLGSANMYSWEKRCRDPGHVIICLENES